MQSSSANSSRIAKNSIFLTVRMAIVTIISIFTTRYLLQNLGVEDYGVYNVTLGIVTMCAFFSSALSNANQRFHNYELGQNGTEGAKKVFNTGLLIQASMVFVIIFFAETMGLWYVQNKLVVPDGRAYAVFWVYQISVIAFSLSMLQIPFVSSILAHENMDFYAVVNVVDAILKLLIAMGIAYSSYDKLIVYGLLLLGINILNFALYSAFSYLKFNEIHISKDFDKILLKQMLSFSGWNLFETVARMGKDIGCNLLLNSFFGPILNAARGVSSQIAYAFSSMVDSTVMASRPQMVVNYAKGNVNSALSMFYTLSKGVLLIILIFSLPVFLEVNYILNLWLGSQIPKYTGDLVRLSLLILFADKLASPVTALIHATGNVKKYHVVSGMLNITVVPFAWLVFSLGYSPSSVYVITLIGALISQSVYLFIIKTMLPFSLGAYFKRVCSPFMVVAISSLPFPLFLHYFMDYGLLRLLAVTVVSGIISMGFTLIWGLTSKEQGLLFSLFKKERRN